MTSQEKKKWLKRYRELDKRINLKLERLAWLRSRAEKSTTDYSDMPRSPTTENQREDTYIKIIALGKEIDIDTDRLYKIKRFLAKKRNI